MQGFACCKIANAMSPQSVILIKTDTKYSIRLIQYTSKNYVITHFKSETIFFDAIDASFFAD